MIIQPAQAKTFKIELTLEEAKEINEKLSNIKDANACPHFFHAELEHALNEYV